ncbi:MAG: hypothetical protein ACK5MH_09220 [Bacteroidales bacterium]
MQKSIGKEYTNVHVRESFLKDNCDKVEEKGYMKPFTIEQLQEYKEKLANVSIEITEIEEDKKEQDTVFKNMLKPLKDSRSQLITNIKSKSEYVKELCFKFVDQDKKMTGFYNLDGDLIESRPATADELQSTIFASFRKTGTED